MARGTTLKNIRKMLKAELGDSAGTNSVRNQELDVLLSNQQKMLAAQYKWEFLEQRWDVSVAAGQRYVAFPTTTAGEPATEVVDMDLDQKPLVEVLYNSVYQPVDYGIGIDEYNTMNPDQQEYSDPIQRWREATNPNEPDSPGQFEVWPVPVTAQTIRFTGQRAVQDLVADNDTADLDDILLVLFVAADRLARSKQADAQIKMQKAGQHLQWLKQGCPRRTQIRTLDGQGDSEWKRQRRLTGMTIIVH